jgi:hypothetical protein
MTDNEYNQKNSERGNDDAAHGRDWDGNSQNPNSAYNQAYYTELGRQHGKDNTYDSTYSNNEAFEKGYDTGRSERLYGHG